jgi:hypothetical protein
MTDPYSRVLACVGEQRPYTKDVGSVLGARSEVVDYYWVDIGDIVVGWCHRALGRHLSSGRTPGTFILVLCSVSGLTLLLMSRYSFHASDEERLGLGVPGCRQKTSVNYFWPVIGS